MNNHRNRAKMFDTGTTFLLLSLLSALLNTASANEEKGKFLGAKVTEYPGWFKESFLHLPEDLEEANGAGKRIMVFFHQAGCPYCNALVERNLAQKDIQQLMQKKFDVIDINMWGDREVTYFNGEHYKEKDLAKALRVQFTPTLIFYDEKGKVVLRLNGYRAPDRFKVELEYVAGKHEKNSNARDFIKTNFKPGKSSKTMHQQDFFKTGPVNLKLNGPAKKPFAVFFEQKDCPNCDTLHNKVLPDPGLRSIIADFDVYQLDMWSKTPVITPDGKNLSARAWANKLNINFAPSIVLFDKNGEEVIRSEAFFKVFHTQGIFDYVRTGAYQKEPSFQRYLSERAEHIREKGKDVDIWQYAK